MQKYVHSMIDFFELFEKLKFTMDKYGSIYTAILFKLKDPTRLAEFQEFLLKYLRISDTVFSYWQQQVLVILEETSIRWAIILDEQLREKIKEKWFSYNYYCSAIQGNFIDSDEELIKNLKRRLEFAQKINSDECIHNLGSIN